MRWLREHGGWASRLALFAIAVQLVVSFGHVHLHTAGQHQPVIGLTAVHAAPGNDQTPAHPAHSDTDCAVCAVLHLAGNLVLPETAVLPVPVAALAHWFAPALQRTADSQYEHFRARAPPLS